MQVDRRTNPGRLRRLAEELAEELPDVHAAVHDHELIVDELDYAERPPRHERRVPSYGSFVHPVREITEWAAVTGLTVVSDSSHTGEGDVDRRYADGIASWVVRPRDGSFHVVVFDRPAGSERDLVVLAEASGATVIQRHPSGVVRLAGSFGVARFDGFGWHVEPAIGSWLTSTACGVDERRSEVFEHLIRFAVHDLGAGGVGATLVFRPADAPDGAFGGGRLEQHLPVPPAFSLLRATDLAPLRHVLGQSDGAAVFDVGGSLRALGVRLVPSVEAESHVEALGGTRHTSARRFSYDEPASIVVTVSDDGPVTVFRRGRVVARSGTAPS